MTAKETERLAKVEQKVDDIKESADKNFGALNQKLDKFIEHADKSFITVAQAKVAIWITGFLISACTLGVLIFNAIHHRG